MPDEQSAPPPRSRKRWRPARDPREITPGQPFVRADHEASDETAWQLKVSYQRLFRGVYVDKTVPITTEVLARAALLVAGDQCYVSHHTAAALWGGITPDDPDIHVTYVGPRAQCTGIAAHRRKVDQDTTRFKGVRLTTALQTFVDLAQVLGLVDLVILGDSLVRRKRFTVAQLREATSSATGPGSRRAKQAARLVRKGVDSAMETRLRLLIVFSGLPEPTVDHRVFDAHGNLLYRFDLAYVEQRLAVEYDGRHHAESKRQWKKDIGRAEQLDEWRVRRLVMISDDIFVTPEATIGRIAKAMKGQGMQVPRLRNTWRRYFPGRPLMADRGA